MKTKSLVFTVLAVLFAFAASATKLPTMNVIPIEKEKALVAFESATPSSFELSIQDENGAFVYYKKSEKPVQTYSMVFNLNQLEEGNYDVCLTYGNYKLSRDMFIDVNGKIKVGEEMTEYAPVYKFENNMLKVSYLNNSLRNVNLTIYQDGHFITGKRLGKDLCIQKVFDLSKLESGKYDVVLSDNTNEYAFHVEK